MTKDVMILAGAGQIGMAIARRMGYGMKIVIGDKNIKNAQTISDIMNKASLDTIALEMDFSSRESVRGMSRGVRNMATSPCLSMRPEFSLRRLPLRRSES